MSDITRIKYFYIKSHYRTLNGLIRINHFNSVNSKIQKSKIQRVRGGKISGRISLVCFGHRLSTVDAILALRWKGLRPLTLQEGLLFSFLRPNAQKHMTIVLAGTLIKYTDDSTWIARLDGAVNKRKLNLGRYIDDPALSKYGYFGWPEHCYFAAIKDTH